MKHHQKGAILLLLIPLTLFTVFIIYLTFFSDLVRHKPGPSSLPTGNLLQTACQEASPDYPTWTQTNSDLVLWETPGKIFNFRNSPEEPLTQIGSPVQPSESLLDMDFIDTSEISYVQAKGNTWQIGLFKPNGLGAPTNTPIYQSPEPANSVNLSPLNRNEFVVFRTYGTDGFLSLLNISNSTSSLLAKIPSIDSTGSKLALSPQGTYVYLLVNHTLTLYEISSRTQLAQFSPAESAVWIGNSHLLYSDSSETYIYNVATQAQETTSLGPASDLAFHPANSGVIAFTQKGTAQVINCQTGQVYNSKPNARLRALASARTAILEEVNSFGFWRFDGQDWTVTFIDKGSQLVTRWQRY